MTQPTDAAEVARKLTPAQRRAIFPGPGNPEYARGPSVSMKALLALGIVKQVNAHTGGDGKRGGLLTGLGAAVRAQLQGEGGQDG